MIGMGVLHRGGCCGAVCVCRDEVDALARGDLHANMLRRVACHRVLALPNQSARTAFNRAWQPPHGGRSILSQRIEAAAAADDIALVRKILAEADAGGFSQVSSPMNAISSEPFLVRRPLMSAAICYFAWNGAASLYAYRVTGRMADELAASHGLATVSLTQRSFSTAAMLTSRGGEEVPSSRRVRVLPHLAVQDLIFGRTPWTLTCRKKGHATRWSTLPGGPPESDDDDDDRDDGDSPGRNGRTWQFGLGSAGGRRGGV